MNRRDPEAVPARRRRARRPPAALAGLAALVCGAVASAHTQPGTLGAAATATDYYQVTCTNDGSGAPASFSVQILDAAPVVSPQISVQVKKGLVVTNTSDLVDGDANPSAAAFVNGGAGVYDVIVDKSGPGAESYTLTFHCHTKASAGGAHAGTTVVTKQNQ